MSSGGSSNLGIKPRSPALQTDSLPSKPPGKPGILKWVAYPFSRVSSWPRNWTRVSCIAGRFFTSRATREGQQCWRPKLKFMLFFSIKVYILSLLNFNLWWSWRRYCLIYKQQSQARSAVVVKWTPQLFLGSQSCCRGKWSGVCVSRRERLKNQQPGSPKQARVLLKNLISSYC